MSQRILVWDLPTRVFHWSFALTFAGAYLTAESERWQPVHLRLGYTFLILLAFRLVWGLVGTRYARFADFVRGPQATLDYLRGLLQDGRSRTSDTIRPGRWRSCPCCSWAPWSPCRDGCWTAGGEASPPKSGTKSPPTSCWRWSGCTSWGYW